MNKRERVAEFMKAYERNLGVSDGAEQAYIRTETDWALNNDRRMYKNYESFRASRVFYLKFTRVGRSATWR